MATGPGAEVLDATQRKVLDNALREFRLGGVALRLRSAFDEPFAVAGRALHLAASAGGSPEDRKIREDIEARQRAVQQMADCIAAFRRGQR